MDDDIQEFAEHAQPGRRYGQCACNTGCGQPGACRSSAMDNAVVQIRAAFGEADSHDLFKRTVRTYIRLGTGHEAVRARYGARLARLRHCGLDRAIRHVEKDYRDERRSYQFSDTLARLVGSPRCPRLPLEVLRELRLILRFVRRSEYRPHYRAIAMLVAS